MVVAQINYPYSLKNYGIALKETFEQKPLKTILKVAAMVATLALSIISCIVLAPLAPILLPITFAITCNLYTLLFAKLLIDDLKSVLFKKFKEHLPSNHSNKNVVLMLEAACDPNNTFAMDSKKNIELLQKEYAVSFAKIKNVGEIEKEIDRASMLNNRIKAVWIRAHGNPFNISISYNETLNIYNAFLLRNAFSKLDPDARIILESCSTAGKNKDNMDNLAQRIAKVAGGRKVIAASRSIGPNSMKLGKTKLLDVEFWAPHKKSRYRVLKTPSKFFNYLIDTLASLFKRKGLFKKLSYNATKVYQT